MRNLIIILFTFSFFISGAQTGESGARRLMDSLMRKEHIPGLAYAIIREGKIIEMQTLGKASLPYNVPVSKTTVFQLASSSKIFCSLLLGKLFDLNMLAPDQTIDKYIDSIPETWKPIRISHLAAHQSGIRISDYSQVYNTKKAIRIAKQMPVEYTPGSQSAYVSSDYWVLQYIIEKVTGMKYYDALKKYVLTPLGLNHSFVNHATTGRFTDMDIVPDIAQEYHWFDNDSTLRINQMWFPESGYTAGGIYSSIEDMAGVAAVFDTPNFFTPKTRALLTQPLMLNDGKPGYYGIGLIINPDYQGHYLVEHSGGPALADFVRFEKEKYTFIVLTNNRGVYPYLAKALATLYIDSLKMPEVPKTW